MSRRKKRVNRQWTTSERRFVADNYPTKTAAEIGALLGRTEPAIVFVAGQMRARAQKPAQWTTSEVVFAHKAKGQGMSLQQIADALGRSYMSVAVKLHRSKGLRLVPDNLKPQLYAFLRLLRDGRRFEQSDVLALARIDQEAAKAAQDTF